MHSKVKIVIKYEIRKKLNHYLFVFTRNRYIYK